MIIYTGCSFGKKRTIVEKLGLGIMSSPNAKCPVNWKGNLAIDNGAFMAYSLGYPFPSEIFLTHLWWHYKRSLKIDFIVCPDIVGGGVDSLKMSLEWANGPLKGCKNLALAVQDGMTPVNITPDILSKFSTIFVGGTVEWKWETIESWVEFAKKNNKKIHIGRCGKRKDIERAKDLEVDSIDSASFARHNRFNDIIELELDNSEIKEKKMLF